MWSELPLTDEIVRAYTYAAGGTLVAARESLERGVGVNIGGGFHHAFADKAEGFCYLNDLAVAVRALQRDTRIRRAAIVDLDVHQGNGTAGIFAGDDSVFTLSIHQRRTTRCPRSAATSTSGSPTEPATPPTRRGSTKRSSVCGRSNRAGALPGRRRSVRRGSAGRARVEPGRLAARDARVLEGASERGIRWWSRSAAATPSASRTPSRSTRRPAGSRSKPRARSRRGGHDPRVGPRRQRRSRGHAAGRGAAHASGAGSGSTWIMRPRRPRVRYSRRSRSIRWCSRTWCPRSTAPRSTATALPLPGGALGALGRGPPAAARGRHRARRELPDHLPRRHLALDLDLARRAAAAARAAGRRPAAPAPLHPRHARRPLHADHGRHRREIDTLEEQLFRNSGCPAPGS